MSDDEQPATAVTNARLLNDSIKELLVEFRAQKNELNSLKEEVRGNSLSVNSEVKKLKGEKNIKWRYEGNQKQFQFNSDLQDSLAQALWAINNGKGDYAREILSDSCDKLKTRNKHIRIADSSEGGWETVRQYEVHPLASDSSDESRINRAEARALKKKKAQKKSKPSSSKSLYHGVHASPYMPLSTGGACGSSSSFQQVGARQNLFRGQPAQTSQQPRLGPCFACGEFSHLRRNCPYVSGAKPEQPSAK